MSIGKSFAFSELEDALVNCPERESHAADRPLDYHEFQRWAVKKLRTHRPVRCKGCDQYLVWVTR